MIEVLRRIILAAGVFTGLWLIGSSPAVLYRVHPIDWNAERERLQGRSDEAKRTMEKLVPGENLEGLDLAPQTRGSLQELIDKQTTGYVTQVVSPAWQGFFNGVAATASGNPPSPGWEARKGRFYADEELFFRPDERPIGELNPVFTDDTSFRYVEITGGQGKQYLGVTKVETGDAMNTAPYPLLYPGRHLGLALIAATILLYAFLPWPRVTRDSLRYSRSQSGVTPDFMAAIVGGMFFILPVLVTSANSFGAGPFGEGWIYLTLGMWLLAAIFASVWVYTARYTALSADWSDGRLRFRNLAGESVVAPEEIDHVEVARIDNPKLSKALIVISVLVSWRAAGPALLASGPQYAVRFVLKDGRVFSFPYKTLFGTPQMVGRLRGAGVAIQPEVYELLNLEPNAPELDQPFPALGKGVRAAVMTAVAVVPLALLALSMRPPAAPVFADGSIAAQPYRDTKEELWVPSPQLMKLESDTLAELAAMQGKMDALEQKVKTTQGEERTAATKEFDALFQRVQKLSDALDKARKDEGAPD